MEGMRRRADDDEGLKAEGLGAEGLRAEGLRAAGLRAEGSGAESLAAEGPAAQKADDNAKQTPVWGRWSFWIQLGLLLCLFLALVSILIENSGEAGLVQQWEFQSEYPLADPGSCGTQEERIKRVIRWTKLHGGYIHPNVTVAPMGQRGGRGLKATGTINHWDPIFRIPQKLQLNLESLKADSQFQAIMKDVPELNDGFSALALYLMHEAQNKSSFWRPFLCSLPESVPLPLFWTDDDAQKRKVRGLPADQLQYFDMIVGKMKDYVLRKYTLLFRKLRRKYTEKFPESSYNRARWAWASSLVLSRNWGRVLRDPSRSVGPGSSVMMQTMAPTADLPNHNTFGLTARFIIAVWALSQPALQFTAQNETPAPIPQPS